MTAELTPALAAFAAGPVAAGAGARDIARLSALDWAAVGRAGATEPVAGIVRRMAVAEGGAAQATIFGHSARLPARAAALVNGATSHALDYDDTHFAHIGHPSVAVFPAALAVAEATGADIARLLEAALVGMELSVRVGLWLGRGHYQAGFHQTATAGTFGAAAAAARLIGLGPDRMAQVLGLAATRAAGLKAQFGTMGKPYNAGLAAAGGVEAAQLVAQGFAANPLALEGDFGFGATHRGEDNTEAALAGLGRVWLMERVSHKFHACCHGLHAALEALRTIDVAAQEAAEIMVHTHPRWMSVCNRSAPETGLGAKFSYATVLAMQMLGHDTARPDSYSDAVCADPALRALRARVEVIADAGLAETAARVAVLRKDGSTLRSDFDLETPLRADLRRDRVRAKAAVLIGAVPAGALWDLLGTDTGSAALGAAIAR